MRTTTHAARPATIRSVGTMTSMFSAATAPSAPCDPRVRVLSVAQLRALGFHPSTITKRCRPGGPWRRLATGVVMLGTGEPTRYQLLQAAIAYLGSGSVITGVDALRIHGVQLPVPRFVHTLVSAQRRWTPPAFVALERTARMPTPLVQSELPFAPPARAVLDAARRENDPDRLRSLLTVPVQEGLCTLDELITELDQGNQRGSAAVRIQLRALRHTIEDRLRRAARYLARRCPLPPPRWDVTITDSTGRRLGMVDAWWDDVGMGWLLNAPSVGSQGPEEQRDELALTAKGVVLVRTAPSMLHHHGDVVATELVRAFRQAATRPRPPVLSEARCAAL